MAEVQPLVAMYEQLVARYVAVAHCACTGDTASAVDLALLHQDLDKLQDRLDFWTNTHIQSLG